MKIKFLKGFYLFTFLTIIMAISSIFMYNEFSSIRQNITRTYITSNIQYVESLSQNIKNDILEEGGEDIFLTLSKSQEIRQDLEKELQLLLTNRYKYIYVLDRPSSLSYRFLLDGSKDEEDKSEFGETYTPLEISKFNEVYSTKQPLYFTHTKIKSLWVTYLYPIIQQGHVRAVIVIDFSMEDYEIIRDILKGFDEIFQIAIFFFFLFFIVIVIVARIDFKREEEKEKIYKALRLKSAELKVETLKVKELNKTLEHRVASEVEKNRQKDKQMLEQSRLAQMGEMISMIAHQWRQPLAAISATSSGLEIKAKLGRLDNKLLLEKVQNISKYAQHLSHTIDDFRDFFKSNKELRQTSYQEIIQSVLDIVSVSVKNKNIDLQVEYQTTKTFQTYPNEIKQVVLNLIKNAEDILLEKEIENGYIRIVAKELDGKFILEVRDNAGGVPEEIIDKVFDPYFSTKLEKNGTGLGLYMSKTIIEDHCGGKLSVHNSQEGAVFVIEI